MEDVAFAKSLQSFGTRSGKQIRVDPLNKPLSDRGERKLLSTDECVPLEGLNVSFLVLDQGKGHAEAC